MYSYFCLPHRDGTWPAPQLLTYLPAPLLLPPIQTHNFCSRPAGLSAREWGTGREIHCFYGAVQPWWAFLPHSAAAVRKPFPAARVRGPWQPAPEPDLPEPWPEGSSLQAELRWGRVERTLGPRLRLPDFVRRELRRVYGTYPRTDVRVTRCRGEFLLQAAPRVGEPEYRVARRVVREQDSGGDSRAAPKAAQRRDAKKS